MYTDEWTTPIEFYNNLNKIYNFNLDPCANIENHKTDLYFDKDIDGLKKSWKGYRVFCNPPYSNIKEWVKKCYYESKDPNTLIVLLIPARTDTKYFHDYILNHADINFVKGRLRFGGSSQNAPFPSIYCVYNSL